MTEKTMSSIKILRTPSQAMRHLHEITNAADANRECLGFLPTSAYEEALKKGKLWVAIDNTGNYVGHILFGGSSARETRIFQLYTAPEHRASGVATALLNEITAYAEQSACLNLRADVASDLPDALKFWQSKGFIALTTRERNTTSKRKVLLFYRRLSTPSLLPRENLSLTIASQKERTAGDFVLDLNIFISILQGRSNDKLISEIMKAALSGEFNLFVTPEFKSELMRENTHNNPALDLAEKTLPVLAKVGANTLEKLKEEIRAIVFPNRQKTRKNAAQDESDLTHLAYCVYSRVGGFITEEKAILSAKDALQKKFSLEILSPENFKVNQFGSTDISQIDIPLQNETGSLSIAEAVTVNDAVKFLDGLNDIPTGFTKIVQKSLGRGHQERKIVRSDENDAALYVTQTFGNQHEKLVGYFISTPHLANRELAFDHVLETFMRLSQTTKAKEVFLYVKDSDFDLEEICLGKGFQRSASEIQGMTCLTKIACPLLITRSNWSKFRESFSRQTNIILPMLIPTYPNGSGEDPAIDAALKGRDGRLKLFDLETFLSPSLLLLQGRPGIMIPIAPGYASSLLARDRGTLPFVGTEEALLRLRKAYFRKPSKSGSPTVGAPIIFYESGKGRGAIGCARITSTETHSIDNAIKLYRKLGVLDRKALTEQSNSKGEVQVIVFDNFKIFSKPIPMTRLKEIGCCRANLAGAEKVEFAHLCQIVHEGLEISSRDVILSIQPDYVAKILAGKKTIELRKKPFPLTDGGRVWIYSTSPTSSIEGTVAITELHKGTPDEIWKNYSSRCGVSKADYDAYFLDADEAYALVLQNPVKLSKKLKLDEIKSVSDGFVPPQYFRYLPHNEALFDALIARLP